MNTFNNHNCTVPDIYCSDCGRTMPPGYRQHHESHGSSAPLCPMCLGAALQRQEFANGCCE